VPEIDCEPDAMQQTAPTIAMMPRGKNTIIINRPQSTKKEPAAIKNPPSKLFLVTGASGDEREIDDSDFTLENTYPQPGQACAVVDT
jgi:hypothetical protein